MSELTNVSKAIPMVELSNRNTDRNQVFKEMQAGLIEGRAILDLDGM